MLQDFANGRKAKLMRKCVAVFVGLLWTVCTVSGVPSGQVITMSTTTSTENSGLLDVLLPEFEKDTGIRVKVLAKGTGAALRDGMDGNVDVIFVHAKKREKSFVQDGHGAYRLGVMHNDFVITGPASDPAAILGLKGATEAFRKIAESKALFVSRGDDSGTHTKEQELWKETGIPLQKEAVEIIKGGEKRKLIFYHPGGLAEWYLSIGQGMGKALTVAEEKQAYVLTDRGTFLKYKYGRKRGLELEIVCEGDPALFNPYGIIPISPKKHPHVNFEAADRFARWLVAPKAQALIAGYTIEERQAFYPDAVPGAR
jgi:tungstate transport system substrate-binding protein